MREHRKLSSAVALAAVLGTMLACSAKTGNGKLALQLVDAPSPVADEIWVNVVAVRAHDTARGWFTVLDTPVPAFDLLKLKDHALELGLTSLPPGTITQVRLIVAPDGNYVMSGGAQFPLVVPSGAESGIKIHGPWTIDACTQTTITLDFDGNKSVWTHPTGQGVEWILRPVIHTKKVEQTDTTCEEGGGTAPPPAGTCDPAAPSCPQGQRCVSGTCLGDLGSPCQQATQCATGACDVSGKCAPGGAGAPCDTAVPQDCLSGVCGSGVCEPGGPGVPCRLDKDCAGASCQLPDGTCGAGAAGGEGTPCTTNDQCLSNSCLELFCAPGVQGNVCKSNADCQAGYACDMTVGCVPVQSTPL